MVHVYFYVPNIIGYARVALCAVGIYLITLEGERYNKNQSLKEDGSIADIIKSQWFIGLVLYIMSFVLDFFDGYAARMFNQSSKYGAVLDMVTDRCATASLLVTLGGVLYRDQLLIFNFLMVLDISSHWYQMQAAEKGHHKVVGSEKNIIVRTFYNVYPFFAYLCAGTEFYYIFLVAARFLPSEFKIIPGIPLNIFTFAQVALLPACISKNIVNLAQLASGAASIAKADIEGKANAATTKSPNKDSKKSN